MNATMQEDILPELTAIRMAKAKALARRIELITQLGGISRYSPHPKQDAFHKAGARYKRRMVRGGNRSGKSTLGCAEDCGWMMGERPWYKKDDPARTAGIPDRPTKGLIISQDWDVIHNVFTNREGETEGKFWRLLPKDYIKDYRKNSSGVISTLIGQNGSVTKFETVQSWKSDPKGVESVDWDYIHVDEPCPKGMWIGASRGLVDRGGSAWFTLTPLSEFWINDMFFPEDTGGRMRDDVWAGTMTIFDNPFLTKEAIDAFAADLSEDEKQCRLYGIPLHLSGLVYKEFDWARHVMQTVPKGWNDFHLPPDDWPVYYAIDPHPRQPHAVLLVTVDPFGRRYYFNDIFENGTPESIAPVALRAMERYDKKGLRNIVRGKIDPIAYIEDQNTGMMLVSRFERAGLCPERAVKDLTNGVLKVRNVLKNDEIMFSPAAKRTLWEIQRYAWQENKEKPVDADDHMMENLYRLELDEPMWVDYQNTHSFPIDEISITRPELEFEPISFSL